MNGCGAMIEFLHDAELIVELLGEILEVRGDQAPCQMIIDLFHDLKDIEARARKILEMRKVRGDTVLIGPERLYMVHMILHARADTARLLETICTPDMDMTSRSASLCDAIMLGSFLQLKMFQSMSDAERNAYYDEALPNMEIYKRFQDLRNDMPLLRPHHRIINKDLCEKVDRYYATLDEDMRKMLKDFLYRPISPLARRWFSLARYWSAPIKEGEFISIDSAEEILSIYSTYLARLRGDIEEICGPKGEGN